MASFAVIIPAAGNGSRFDSGRTRKQFLSLSGRPVWLRSVEHFAHRDDVSEVMLVLPPDELDDFRARNAAHLALMNLRLTAGGATRADSVRNGLSSLTADCDFVAVHDAARPLLTSTLIDEIFRAAVSADAVIPVIAVNSTVKSVDADGNCTGTVDRSSLRLAQTPQVFRRTVLEAAYEAARDLTQFTDESSLVEASGVTVRTVPGSPMNIKITTKADLETAEFFRQLQQKSTGLRDLHPFGDERRL